MKIKTFSVMLALVLLLGSFSISASAVEYTNEEFANMDIGYNIDYGYTVNIPTSANMSNGQTFEITASNVILPSGQVLSVDLETVMSLFSDDIIPLKNDEAMVLNCKVYREDIDGNNKIQITSGDVNLALFRSGETKAYSGGVVSLSPVLTNGVTAGGYSGKLYFIISTIDASSLS